MSQARREQMRFTMLPHIGGKFDVERFIKTGVTFERKAYPPPDTPQYRQALADAFAEKERLERRGRNGQ